MHCCCRIFTNNLLNIWKKNCQETNAASGNEHNEYGMLNITIRRYWSFQPESNILNIESNNLNLPGRCYESTAVVNAEQPLRFVGQRINDACVDAQIGVTGFDG